MQRVPLLGAVGPLQFEVVQYRLNDEYGAESRLEQTNWKVLRWLHPAITIEQQNDIVLPAGAAWALDTEERTVILFTSEWSNNYFIEKNPKILLSDIPFVLQRVSEDN
jgi:peptide chain release factor 3